MSFRLPDNVKTTPEMTRFRDVKVCKNLVTDEIDNHRIQSFRITVLPKDVHTDFAQEASMFDHDLGHLCRGRRIQKSGHCDSGILSNFGTSSILT